MSKMEMTEALAFRLAMAYSAILEAARPKVAALARAKFDGMCEATHAMGMGMTPAEVALWVKDVIDVHGAMPRATAWNLDRKEWRATVTAAVLRKAGAVVKCPNGYSYCGVDGVTCAGCGQAE